MIGFYNYTVILTYIGLVTTVFGITQAINGNFEVAIFCLIGSGFCDMFDGVIARTHKTRSESAKKFGIQIDSLCDVICFGAFPAIFNYVYTIKFNPKFTLIATVISALYLLAGIIRLGYFNVTEEERQKTTSEPRKYYQGMPITSVAGFLPLLFTFRNRIAAFDINFAVVLNIFCVIIGLLFVLDIPVAKAHKRGIIIMSVCAAAMIAVLVLQFNGVISF